MAKHTTDAPGHGPAPTGGGSTPPVSRRGFLQTGGAALLLVGLGRLTPAYAQSLAPLGGGARLRGVEPGPLAADAGIDLAIRNAGVTIRDRRVTTTTINDTVPGPLLRLQEGGEALIRVTNGLREDTSLHWHGVLVPNPMDGVPEVNFPGIKPGETFTYRFPLKQYGTYWYHSHSGLQEQTGVYGPLIIDPADPEPFAYDREFVVMLSDWSFENPYEVLDKLKKKADYYQFQKRTVADFFDEVERFGWRATIKDRLAWSRMRMSPIDISDITGATYTFLMNGQAPSANWSAIYRPGERVRLRFINAGAGTNFDVRIPGLEMTVVQVSGQNVQPVVTDEFRMGIAETYDVIVQPAADRAYTIFAESADRSGYARGTLAPRAGMTAEVPNMRRRPLLSMMDMGMMHGMGDMGGMGHGGMPGMDMKGMHSKNDPGASASAPMPAHDMGAMTAKPDSAAWPYGPAAAAADSSSHANMPGMQMPGMQTPPAGKAAADSGAHANMPGMTGAAPATSGSGGSSALRAPGTLPEPVMHSGSKHGAGNASIAMETRSRLAEPGVGLGKDGWRVLVYSDLRALHPRPDALRPPTREIEFHLTGNMERYMWSIDGKKFSEAPEPIHMRRGERIRLTMVNDTMMAHPMHLHGMWMELENGTGADIPRVHTINVKPAERVSVLVTPEDLGPWAFHCHVLLHMELGMFRVVHVHEGAMPPTTTSTSTAERGQP